MSLRPSRRTAIKTGLSMLAAVRTAVALGAQATSRQTTVLFLLGDYHHNGAMQEYAWRLLLGPTGWRLRFAQSPSFITDEVMAGADLYVLCRYQTKQQDPSLALGWSPDKIVETRPEPDVFMTPEHERMIVANVRRGMGLISMHCGLWNLDNRQYLDVLGIDTPIIHGPVVATHMFNLNQEHPITKGINAFDVGIDEAFDAKMKPGQYTELYRSKQDAPPRDAIGAWCREEGRGRVVALLAGHTPGPYGKKEFQEIMWRSVYWSLQRDIPPYVKA